MLNESTISRVTKYWASHLGSQTLERFAQPFHTIVHGPELADYRGIFALFRDNAATVSVPQELADSVRAILLVPPESPTAFASVFRAKGFVTIGPAYIGYADEVQAPPHPARSLTGADLEAVKSLQAVCNAIEWEHGSSNLEQCPSFGVFVKGQLATLAGYAVWGDAIAHISVITHPAFRDQDFGKSAVAHAARSALSAGLIPQYRTLESNLPSMRVADSLGFCRYATSVAVRLSV